MSPTTTNTTERLAFDGPIGLSLSVALGLLLVALFAWALWRERKILGRRNTMLFGVLRCVALAAVIWLLLAPNRVRVDTSTTRQAVAFVTDVSGSMQTVDPAGSSDDLRWAVSSSPSERKSATEATDRAIAAIGVAQQQLLTATEALAQHKAESIVVEATSSANTAVDRAREHLQSVTDGTGAVRPSSESTALAARLLNRLNAPEFKALDQLCTALERGRTPSQKGWRESLPDLEYQLAGIHRTLQELARRVTTEETGRVAQDHPELLTAVQNAPRLARAGSFLERLEQSSLAAVRDEADVRLSSFDLAVRRLNDPDSPQRSLAPWLKTDEPPSEASGTDLSAVMDEVRRERQDQPLAAVFVLTDVHQTHASETNPRDAARSLEETPVYVVPIGNTDHVRDVILQSVSAPAVAMRNDDVVIEVALQAHDCEGEVCLVQLLQDGDVVDFREVALDSAFASRSVRFERQMPTIGDQKFQVAVTPLEGEASEDNNYEEFEVNVTRSDIKVLLADEMPRWEYRYLAQLFRRDPKVECDELLYHPRMIATGRREETKTVPITVDDWDQYDVVILGDLPPEHLPEVAQESLTEYLQKRGGTLVLIAGHAAMPQAYVNHSLEQLLPVLPVDGKADASGYAFFVTDEGRDHQALMIAETEEETRSAWDFVNRFSPLQTVSAWRRPRPAAHTLIAAIPRGSLDEDADAKNSAFLCWQPVGRGQVVYLSGPDTYRLRFLRGDQLHYRFWGQLLRWVIASDLSAGTEFVRIRTDKSRYETREDVQATVRLIDAEGEPVVVDNLSVRVISGDNERTVPLSAVADVPGEYAATIRSLPPGVYRIEPVGEAVDELQQGENQEPASASFTVQAELPLELVDTRCDRALAQQIADVTGGQVLPPTAVDEVLKLTDLAPIVSEKLERRPLWLEWKYLWLVFSCLQVEWIVRKWRGLS